MRGKEKVITGGGGVSAYLQERGGGEGHQSYGLTKRKPTTGRGSKSEVIREDARREDNKRGKTPDT